MQNLLKDFSFAWRTMCRRPGFSAAVILTLGLGIGGGTAVSSLVWKVLFQLPGYTNPDRLVILHNRVRSSGGGYRELRWSYPYYEDFKTRRLDSIFDGMAAYAGWHLNLTGHGTALRLPVEMVSADYFSVLGVQAERGRVFQSDEDEMPGGHPLVVISNGMWQRLFGKDPGVLGQKLTLDNLPFTIVGVMPRGFRGLTGQAEAWVPMTMAPKLTFARRLSRRWASWHEVVARLRPGVEPGQARRVLAGILQQIHQAKPPPNFLSGLQVDPVRLQEDRVDPSLRRALWILLAAVGSVLAIAAANVAGLFLVRSTRRRREIAVRLALGSSRARLLRLFVSESLLLGLVSGVVGLVVAWAGLQLVRAFNPVSPEVSSFLITHPAGIRFDAIHLGFGVLLFNFTFALAVGCAVGLYPALRSARIDITRWIKQASAGVDPSGALASLRVTSPLQILATLQIAVSLVLLTGAGLTIRSLVHLYTVPLGFKPDHLLTLRLSHPFSLHFETAQIQDSRRMLQRLRSLPGVQAASFTNRLPLSVVGEQSTVRVKGESYDEGKVPSAQIHTVGPEYFEALQIPLLRGRTFEGRDGRGTPRVAVVNQEAVRSIFHSANPIGQQIRLGIGWKEGEYATVIGTVGNASYTTIEDREHAAVYIPYTQNPYWSEILVLRTKTRPESLIQVVRQTIQKMDAGVPVYDVAPMTTRIRRSVSKIRFSSLLLSVFAGVAFFLTFVGIYGLVAFSVANRTREIGVRVALGAESKSIVRMLLAEGATLAIAGTGIGLGMAFLITPYLSRFLIGLSPYDPATLALTTLGILAATLMGTWLPARRALRVSPVEALRCE